MKGGSEATRNGRDLVRVRPWARGRLVAARRLCLANSKLWLEISDSAELLIAA